LNQLLPHPFSAFMTNSDDEGGKHDLCSCKEKADMFNKGENEEMIQTGCGSLFGDHFIDSQEDRLAQSCTPSPLDISLIDLDEDYDEVASGCSGIAGLNSKCTPVMSGLNSTIKHYDWSHLSSSFDDSGIKSSHQDTLKKSRSCAYHQNLEPLGVARCGLCGERMPLERRVVAEHARSCPSQALAEVRARILGCTQRPRCQRLPLVWESWRQIELSDSVRVHAPFFSAIGGA